MNDDKAAGIFDEVKGKIKQAAGELTGNESLANSGAADQVKGDVQQTWGNVKDTASHATDTPSSSGTTGSDLRDKVTSGSENLKNSVASKLNDLEHKRN